MASTSEKQKEHMVTLRVKFDKPVSHAAAVRFAKNHLRHNGHYATIEDEERDGWTRAFT